MTATVGQQAQAAARANDVWKVYGSGEAQVIALRGVSVEFERGRFTAIMGPSGFGQVDADALPGRPGLGHPGRRSPSARRRSPGWPTRGLTKLRRDKVGFIFQQFNLLPTLTAEENILLPLSIAGRKPDPAWYDTVIDDGRAARPAGPPARRSSPAASSSGWPAPGRWSPGPR